MAIRVNVNTYCEDCPNFKPTMIKNKYADSHDTIISCVNSEQCEYVAVRVNAMNKYGRGFSYADPIQH